jgi:hypothetical protein
MGPRVSLHCTRSPPTPLGGFTVRLCVYDYGLMHHRASFAVLLKTRILRNSTFGTTDMNRTALPGERTAEAIFTPWRTAEARVQALLGEADGLTPELPEVGSAIAIVERIDGGKVAGGSAFVATTSPMRMERLQERLLQLDEKLDVAERKAMQLRVAYTDVLEENYQLQQNLHEMRIRNEQLEDELTELRNAANLSARSNKWCARCGGDRSPSQSQEHPEYLYELQKPPTQDRGIQVYLEDIPLQGCAASNTGASVLNQGEPGLGTASSFRSATPRQYTPRFHLTKLPLGHSSPRVPAPTGADEALEGSPRPDLVFAHRLVKGSSITRGVRQNSARLSATVGSVPGGSPWSLQPSARPSAVTYSVTANGASPRGQDGALLDRHAEEDTVGPSSPLASARLGQTSRITGDQIRALLQRCSSAAASPRNSARDAMLLPTPRVVDGAPSGTGRVAGETADAHDALGHSGNGWNLNNPDMSMLRTEDDGAAALDTARSRGSATLDTARSRGSAYRQNAETMKWERLVQSECGVVDDLARTLGRLDDELERLHSLYTQHAQLRSEAAALRGEIEVRLQVARMFPGFKAREAKAQPIEGAQNSTALQPA